MKTFNHNIYKQEIPASATVEGALVIPLVVYAAAAIIFMLQVVAVKIQVSNAVYNSIRRFSRYAYVREALKDMSDTDKTNALTSLEKEDDNLGICRNGLTIAEFAGVFISELGSDFAKSHYISGGNAGWDFSGSQILKENSSICITLRYSIKNPFDIFGLTKITMQEKTEADAWLGERYDRFTPSEEVEDDEYVYITESGEVYHTDPDCSYITRDIKTANIEDLYDLRNASGSRYYECGKCAGDAVVVYYTLYGEKYHNSINCSDLQRNVIAVKKDRIKGMSLCSKCAEKSRK